MMTRASLDFNSWDASVVLTLVIYGKKWCPIWSLIASLTGKTIDLEHVSLIHGLTDSWGSLRYSWFVPLLLSMADI